MISWLIVKEYNVCINIAKFPSQKAVQSNIAINFILIYSIVVKIEWYIFLRTVSHKVKCFVIFNMYFAFQL